MRGMVHSRLAWAISTALVAVAISVPALALGHNGGAGRPAHAAKKKKKKTNGVRGPRGLTGPMGPRGFNGLNGPPGGQGPKGDSGSARGFALVNADGTYDTTHSSNVAWVHREDPFSPPTGSYCVAFNGVDSASSIANVGTDKAGDTTGTADVAHAEWDSSLGDCPAGSFRVKTYESYADCLATDDPGGDTYCAYRNRPHDQPFAISVP